MKKNYMMRIASVLLVVILLTTCAISATFAKYSSTGTGTATANVATWSVKFNGVALSQNMTVNLFETIINDNATAGFNGGTVSAKVIAPGTSGTITVPVANESQVAAEYTVTCTADESPLEITVVNGTGNLEIGGSANVTIKWVWPFGEDTDDNEWAGEPVEAVVNVTISQVD